ncbi:MAG: putative Se/S carrier-like protein [Eubacteriales bacterium]
MEQRIIVTGSQTSALKAKRLLENSGIRARVVRPPSYSEDGCRYGIEINLINIPQALSLLGEARMSFLDIIKS